MLWMRNGASWFLWIRNWVVPTGVSPEIGATPLARDTGLEDPLPLWLTCCWIPGSVNCFLFPGKWGWPRRAEGEINAGRHSALVPWSCSWSQPTQFISLQGVDLGQGRESRKPVVVSAQIHRNGDIGLWAPSPNPPVFQAKNMTVELERWKKC